MPYWPYRTTPEPWVPSHSLRTRPEPIRATLQGIEFGRSVDGVEYTITEFDGWTNGASARGGRVSRPYSDGGFSSRVDMDSRSLRLAGLITAPTQRRLWVEMERLGAVLTSPRWDYLVVDEDFLGMSRQVEVSRIARPQITELAPLVASYTLDLEAADYPRLSVDEQVVSIARGSSAPVVNAGDYPAVLEAMFYGPLTQPRLRFGGDLPGTWRYGANINAGQRLQVEFDRRIVRNPDTQGHSRVYASGDWPRLAPGQTTFHLEGSGTGRVELKWRSAWN